MSQHIEPRPLPLTLRQEFIEKELMQWRKPLHDLGHHSDPNAAYTRRLNASIDLAQMLYPRAREIWKTHGVTFRLLTGDKRWDASVRREENKLVFTLGTHVYLDNPRVLSLTIVSQTVRIGYTGGKRPPTNLERLYIAVAVDQANRRLGPLRYLQRLIPLEMDMPAKHVCASLME